MAIRTGETGDRVCGSGREGRQRRYRAMIEETAHQLEKLSMTKILFKIVLSKAFFRLKNA